MIVKAQFQYSSASVQRNNPREIADGAMLDADSPINEESDFTFASIGSSVYTKKMLSSGHLPYVARGVTGTMIQAAEGKANEGRRSFRSPDGSRRARAFQGAESIPRQTGGGAVEKPAPEEQSRREHVGQGGELHHTGLLEQVLTKSMESATHIARNFPQKFREHAGAHLEKAKEMPRMMSAFAAKNVNMLEKIIATISKTGKDDGNE